MLRLRTVLLPAALTAVLALPSADARADDTIKHPGDHPNYSVEVEPHLVFGLDNVYASNGYGAGVRIGIPIVQNGFVPSINNSVAISFGAELVHYDYCFWKGFNCSANALVMPVAMQWNFFVAPKWSVFGEPGVFLWKGFLSNPCGNAAVCGQEPSSFAMRPALYLGGRYYFSEHVTLTMRIGYPTFSVGVSFM
jgi:hypothetical protein